MKRYDLRHLGDNFYEKMREIIRNLDFEEVGIFLFEIGDFSSVSKSATLVNEENCEIMNSIKFNEVDWTIVVKKGKI